MGIYGAGKAFNLRYAQNTFVPNRGITVRQARPQQLFGGHCHGGVTNTNITINNGPRGFWGFMSGFLGGLFGGGGMMGMGGGLFGGLFNNLFGGLFGGGMMGGFNPYGMINAQQAQPQQQPQAGNQDKLANLKTLYPNHNIVSDGDDKYSATDKEGNLIGQGLTYEEMCKALAKEKEEKAKVNNDDGKVNNDDGKVNNDDGKVNNDDGRVNGNDGRVNGNGGRVNGNGGKVNSNNGANATGNQIDKTKPVSVKITFSIHTNSTNSGTATVVMPDGTEFTAETGPSLTHNRAMNALSDDIMNQLKQAGWTNVTLTNSNFKFQKGNAASSTQQTQGAQQTQSAKTTQWTAAEKAKPRKLQITFRIHTMRGNDGTAYVTTPDNKTHKVETGMSLTHQRAMEDLSNKMKATLSQAGWTNVTLVNQNFNWSD